MTDGRAVPSSLPLLEERVRDILNEDTTAVYLLSRVEFFFVVENDQYPDWHSSTPLAPMIRALLYKELKGLNFTELTRRLDQKPEIAEGFGFDDVPSRSTFSRAWRNRFDDPLRAFVSEGADRILEIAQEAGAPIASQAVEPEDKSGVSKRTENRFIAEKAEDVTREMQRLVFPTFEFNRAENAKYESDAFLELQSHLGLTQSAAESGTKLFDHDTPRDEGSPDADTHLRNIKRLSPELVIEMLDEAIGRIVKQAKRNLEFQRPVDVAIDMTYMAYYGESDELEMVRGAPPSKSYDWCFKFGTVSVVGDNIKFTLAMRPIRKGIHVGDVVRELIEAAQEHVSISMVFADSEFCAVNVIRTLEEKNIRYVIPSPKNKRIRREIDRMRQDVVVKQEYALHGPKPDSGAMERAETTLILLPSTKDESKTVAFITDRELNDEILADRYEAQACVDRYSRRWGIENSYKTIKDFLAWSTSKDFVVRLFYFGFAVLLYNMWLLVDQLVQMSLDIEQRYKPRVTAKRFLNLARKYLIEPG